MVKVKTEVDQEKIREIVQQIVEHFHPTKVILFGSYAYGVPTEDSDVDLLVVMDAGGSTLRAAATISATIAHPFPIDIIVFEPQHLQASLESGGVFATEVATNGVVLYES